MAEREEVASNFASGLRAFMARSGLGMRELGRRTGMSGTNVHRLSQGKSLPLLDKVASLVEAGMASEEIFGNELAEKLAKDSRTQGRLHKETEEDSTRVAVAEGIAAMLEKLRESRKA